MEALLFIILQSVSFIIDLLSIQISSSLSLWLLFEESSPSDSEDTNLRALSWIANIIWVQFIVVFYMIKNSIVYSYHLRDYHFERHSHDTTTICLSPLKDNFFHKTTLTAVVAVIFLLIKPAEQIFRVVWFAKMITIIHLSNELLVKQNVGN